MSNQQEDTTGKQVASTNDIEQAPIIVKADRGGVVENVRITIIRFGKFRSIGLGLVCLLVIFIPFYYITRPPHPDIDYPYPSELSNWRTELVSILDSIERHAKDTRLNKGQSLRLTDAQTGRILALSQSLRPYLYKEIPNPEEWYHGSPEARIFPVGFKPTRTRTPLSPERGLLLTTLVSMRVDLQHLIDAGVSFEAADLRGRHLYNVDLSKGDFQYSDMTGAKLQSVKFINADLSYVVLDGANLIGADFMNASLDHTSFIKTRLNHANFNSAYLRQAVFSEAILFESVFTDAVLLDANLEGAIPDRADDAGLGIGSKWLDSLEKIQPPPQRYERRRWTMQEDTVTEHPYLEGGARVWKVARSPARSSEGCGG